MFNVILNISLIVLFIYIYERFKCWTVLLYHQNSWTLNLQYSSKGKIYDLEMFSVGMVHCYVVELDHLLVILHTYSLVDTVETWNILGVVECWAEAIHFICYTGVVKGVCVCHENSWGNDCIWKDLFNALSNCLITKAVVIIWGGDGGFFALYDLHLDSTVIYKTSVTIQDLCVQVKHKRGVNINLLTLSFDLCTSGECYCLHFV